MAMTRDQVLAVIHNLETGQLLKMLDTAGIHMPEGGMGGTQMHKHEPLPSWNDVKIKVKTDQRPELVTRHPQPSQAPPVGLRKAVPAYLEEENTGGGDSGDEAG